MSASLCSAEEERPLSAVPSHIEAEITEPGVKGVPPIP